MLTYIYCDNVQIARYGDAKACSAGETIYLDDNTAYEVTVVDLALERKTMW